MLPSKEEIKKKYGISDADFDVLQRTSLPSPEELRKEKSFLRKIGDWFGLEVWAKLPLGAKIISAIIFVGAVSQGVEYTMKHANFIYVSAPQVVSYLEDSAYYLKDQAEYLLVYKEKSAEERSLPDQNPDGFALDTRLYPVSGAWIPS